MSDNEAKLTKAEMDQLTNSARVHRISEVRGILQHVIKETVFELIAAATPVDIALKINFRKEMCEVLKEVYREISEGSSTIEPKARSKPKNKS